MFRRKFIYRRSLNIVINFLNLHKTFSNLFNIGNFRRGRGGQNNHRYISPVRSSGNIFAEDREHRKRKSKKSHRHHHQRSSRSSTPNKRSRRSTISGSSKDDGNHKDSRNSSRSSIRSKFIFNKLNYLKFLIFSITFSFFFLALKFSKS